MPPPDAPPPDEPPGGWLPPEEPPPDGGVGIPPEGGLIPPPGGVITGVVLQPTAKTADKVDTAASFAKRDMSVPRCFILFPNKGRRIEPPVCIAFE
jgi:hypothetical protein